MFLAISQMNARPNSLLLRWSGSEFINFQEVPVNGTTQVEALTSGDDIYLIFAKTVFLGEKIIVFLLYASLSELSSIHVVCSV